MCKKDLWNDSTAPLLPLDDTATSSSIRTPLELNDTPSTSPRFPTFCLILTPIVILIPLIFAAAIFLPPPPTQVLLEGGHSNRPAASSLLQIVDERGRFIDPRNNSLLSELKRGQFHSDWLDNNGREEASVELKQNAGLKPMNPVFKLKLNRQEIEFGQELQVAWLIHNGNEFDLDHDVIITFSCHDKRDEHIDIAKHLLDASTLAQIKATHSNNLLSSKTANQQDVKNVWIIPSFPIVHANSCQFHMLKKKKETTLLNSFNEAAASVHFDILAATNPISLTTSQELPTAIHLGLSSSMHSRYIQFTTGLPGQSIVEIAKKNENNDQELNFVKLTGSSTTYSASDMCQSPATNDGNGGYVNPGHLHTVKAENLESGQYVYRVGLAMGQGVRWSEYFEFMIGGEVVSVADGADASSSAYDSKDDGSGNNAHTNLPITTFLALADQGCEQTPDSQDTPAAAPSFSSSTSSAITDLHVRPGKAAAQDVANLILSIINNTTISSIHHLGDLSYANGAGHLWDQYMTMIQPYASRVPVTVGVGNHEYDHTQGGENKDPSGVVNGAGFQPYWGNFGEDSGGECGVPLSKRFAVPENGNGVYWYSFNQPLVHTIMLSTEHNLTSNSSQYQWLEQDLKAVNRSITPWLIVEMHRPMYDKYQDEDTIAVALEYEIEDLLYQYDVDVVLSGHFHCYLRTCDGLYRGQCDNGGPTYITVGTGGAPLDGGDHAGSFWIEKYDGTRWGVGKASILNASSLHWEFVAVGGVVQDDIVISRDRL